LAALLLAGAGASAARAQLTTKTLVYQGVTRTWFQHIPLSYDGARRVPLVVALHGFDNSGDQYAADSEWMPKADAAGFIVVFPNGGNAVNNNFAWNSYVFAGEAPDDAGFLLALIDEMKKDYPIDPSRVYMTGFSNGGGMASTFALLHASVLAGVAPVSGGWQEKLALPGSTIKPDAPIPVWIWRGTAEEVGNGPAGQLALSEHETAFWADFDGDKKAPQVYRQAPYTTSIYRGGKAEVRYTVIDGAAHGILPDLPEKIWNGFFAIFSRQGTAIVYHRPK
jgi:poly(3-hydroxybutyrate) depolymerase